MKIFRFRHSRSYGYIRAGFFERRAIRKRIADGDTRMVEVTWEPGPKAYGAKFIITGRKGAYE